MVRAKICGITNLEDAKAAINAGADALGFVFAKSPRQIKPQDAARIIDELPPFVNCAGVFVDAPVKIVEKIARQCKTGTLQFHGNESHEYCSYFRKKYKVIKAFRIKNKKDLKDLAKYKVDGYLLDTFVRGIKGGTGKAFDWRLAKQAKKIVSPIILSGGLNPENIADAIRLVKPYAVDVSSGVELRPREKDKILMEKFIKEAKYVTG